MKRTPLSQISATRKAWNKRYMRMKQRAVDAQKCAKCGVLRHKDGMECHHPFGRVKERILAFLWLCNPCHSWIHDHGGKATEEGWLQPEFRGMPSKSSTPKPWAPDREADWPDELKRAEAPPPTAPALSRPSEEFKKFWVKKARERVKGRYKVRSNYNEEVDTSGAKTRAEYLAHVREESERQRLELLRLRLEHEENERKCREYAKTLLAK